MIPLFSTLLKTKGGSLTDRRPIGEKIGFESSICEVPKVTQKLISFGDHENSRKSSKNQPILKFAQIFWAFYNNFCNKKLDFIVHAYQFMHYSLGYKQITKPLKCFSFFNKKSDKKVAKITLKNRRFWFILRYLKRQISLVMFNRDTKKHHFLSIF